jgi:hypothetical protein
MRRKYYDSNLQIYAMRSHYPQFKAKRKGRTEIEFVGELIVKPELPAYTVSITYRGDLRPAVKIIKPELIDKPPHIFPDTRNLCLYHSRNYRWTREKFVAKDIVSWTAGWIYFYEVWLQTGVWYGPEAPHSLSKSEK